MNIVFGMAKIILIMTFPVHDVEQYTRIVQLYDNMNCVKAICLQGGYSVYIAGKHMVW